MVGIAFVANKGNETLERLVGACLLFERTAGGESILVIRGINPLQNVITGLSSESFAQEFMKYVKPIAEARGIRRIAAPVGVTGTLSNRPEMNTAFGSLYGNNEKVTLDEPLTFNDYIIGEVTVCETF